METPEPVAPEPTHLQEAVGAEAPHSNFNYDYLEVAAAFGDLDGGRLNGTFHIDGPWIAMGRVDFLTEDEGAADIDLWLLSAGVGYVHPLEENLDLIGSGEVEYGEVEVDTPGNSVDDDDVGVRVRGGLRFQATDEFELAGGLSLSTIFDDELGADGQALYAFNETLSGFVGFDIRDDSIVLVGLRFNF